MTQSKTTGSAEYQKAQSLYAKHFEDVKKAASEIAKVSEHKDFQAHAQQMGMRAASINIPNLIKSLTGEVCKDWPILKQVLDYAKMIANIPFLSFLAPTISAVIGVIGPFVDMIDQQLIPLVCAASPAGGAVSTGGGTSEVQHR